MPHDPRYSAARRAGMLASLIAAAASGRLRIYSGVKPADADAVPGDALLLAELTLGKPAFGAPAYTASGDAVLTANPITTETDAKATGNATWYRVWDAAGTEPLWDGTVGTAETDPDLPLNNTAIQIHAAVSISGLTITIPA